MFSCRVSSAQHAAWIATRLAWKSFRKTAPARTSYFSRTSDFSRTSSFSRTSDQIFLHKWPDCSTICDLIFQYWYLILFLSLYVYSPADNKVTTGCVKYRKQSNQARIWEQKIQCSEKPLFHNIKQFNIKMLLDEISL